MSEPSLVLPADPFGRTAPLLFDASYPFAGVRLRVRSNARAVIALADGVFGVWRALPDALVRRHGDATLDVIVAARTGDPLPSRLDYRRHGPLFLAAAGPVQYAVRLPEQHAVAFVPAQALDDAEWFGTHICGAGILAAVQRDRVPVHAAAVVAGDRTFLLVGDSGAGKSTMAYAGAAAGFAVLAEDTVFVDLTARPVRLWGEASRIWLAPDAVDRFPELAGAPLVARANGKRRLAAPLDAAPTLTTAGAVSIVRLERGPGEPRLAELPAAEIAAQLERDATSGFDQFPESRPGLVAWVGGLDAFRLDTARSPQRAAQLLAALATRHPVAP
jgi:hypothetical protein